VWVLIEDRAQEEDAQAPAGRCTLKGGGNIAKAVERNGWKLVHPV